jgi:hypothetical protein
LVTSYVGYFRGEAWYSERVLTQALAMREFADEVATDGFTQTTVEGLRGFIQRSNATIHRGWAVVHAEEHGYDPELVFGPLAYVFIPRVLWPDKPEVRQGWEFSGRIFGMDFMAWSTSSTAAGLYTSFYLGYGWLAVIVGSVAVGFIMATLARLAKRLGGDILVGLFCFALLPFALRLDETWAVGALSGPIIGFAYLYCVFAVSRILDHAFARQVGKPLSLG